MQVSPLSPSLYNLATDHVLAELSEENIAYRFSFKLGQNLKPLTILGFADNTQIQG